MHAKAIMIQGTGSNVGKSILVCALCRILHQDGIRVAPFKSQNMSLNSYVTLDGREMGRAQVAQAEAAGLQPIVEMNPILLKPTGNNGSQVITMGRPLRHMKAGEYYQNKGMMLDIAMKAYARLREQFDIIVIEGAGSPSEINLKDSDIVNMKIAKTADAPVLLVTDIERGGAFAWIVGTLELLENDERERICGVIINKFRGDIEILKPGISMLEEKINKPVLGVIPYFDDIRIDNEDSVCLDNISYKSQYAAVKSDKKYIDIVVVRLPRISNFTDFDLLMREKDIRLRFIDSAESFGEPDLIILPGTKNTIGDLKAIKDNGIADTIIEFAQKGTMIMGICGGYQMLGREINDPHNAESDIPHIKGLGLLDAVTLFSPVKKTYQIKARIYNKPSSDAQNSTRDMAADSHRYVPGRERFHSAGNKDVQAYIFNNIKCDITGYEIHMGETRLFNGLSPFLRIIERSGKNVRQGESRARADEDFHHGVSASGTMCIYDGAVSDNGNIIGTYVHGILDNDEFRFELINYLRKNKGISHIFRNEIIKAKKDKEEQYDRLADLVRKNLNMDLIYKLIGTQIFSDTQSAAELQP